MLHVPVADISPAEFDREILGHALARHTLAAAIAVVLLTGSQDLAGVGSDLRGKKVVISVSPPWFFANTRPPNFYAR
jgi:hypothetical protein